MGDPTFRYHPKHGAEIFDSEEVEALSELGWVDSPADFKCSPYDAKNSFKAKWKARRGKLWTLEDYIADNPADKSPVKKKVPVSKKKGNKK
jgi:hypothetical protein